MWEKFCDKFYDFWVWIILFLCFMFCVAYAMWIWNYASTSLHTTAKLLDELHKKSGTVSLQSDEEYTVYLDGVLQPNDCFEINAIDVKNYSITINNEDKRIDVISAK